MVIFNKLVSDSFSYKNSHKPISLRKEEQEELHEIIQFCKKIGEKVYYDSTLLNEEVEEGVLLYELLYGIKSAISKDGIDFLMEMFHKECKQYTSQKINNPIYCSCGTFDGAAENLTKYAKERQKYLKKMKNHKEYGAFMRNCFPNSVFADDCEKELAYIKNFSDNIEEITNCLSLLDEKAVTLYKENRTNLKNAMQQLETEIKRTCAPDAAHKQYLNFEFTYEEECGNDRITTCKLVECQPHFKLIRDDSDLRIYFYWKDDDIEHGEKVLIGRVGRHPWKK